MDRPKFLIWQAEYSVGNEALDSQHKRMFDIINTLYAAMRRGVSRDEINQTFRSLTGYAQTHFRDEEKAMRACDYPDLIVHQNAHRAYVARVEGLMREFRNPGREVSHDMLIFLKDWWKTHIAHMDKQYAPFITHPSEASKSMNSDKQ